MRLLRSLVLLLLALPAAVVADDAGCVDYRVLLGVDASEIERGAQLAALEQATALDSSAARYVLGLLYLRGLPQGPAVVALDAAKAESLLARAAVSGRMEALALMTEVALVNGKGQEAAVWAQLSGYYARKAKGRVAPGFNLYSMRNIGLARAGMRTTGSAQLAIEYMGGMIERHDATIQRGIDAGPGIDHAVCGADASQMLIPAAGYYVDGHTARKDAERKRRRATVADYSIGSDLLVALLEVGGDGAVRQAYPLRWLGPSEDAGPAIEAARSLRFQSFGEADRTRWAIVPVTAWIGDRARND